MEVSCEAQGRRKQTERNYSVAVNAWFTLLPPFSPRSREDSDGHWGVSAALGMLAGVGRRLSRGTWDPDAGRVTCFG